MERLNSRQSSRGTGKLQVAADVLALDPGSPGAAGSHFAKHMPHRAPSLDDVAFSSRETHEQAIKETLQLMNGEENRKTGRKKSTGQSPMKAIGTQEQAVTRKSSNSFLPSLSVASYYSDFPDSSGLSTPSSSVNLRQRATPQLPPPPSCQRPGPDFPRTVLAAVVPEMSESQVSLVMTDGTAALRGAEYAESPAPQLPFNSPGRKKGSKKPASKQAAGKPAPSPGRGVAASASPVAIVSPLPSVSHRAGQQERRHQNPTLDLSMSLSPSELSLSRSMNRPFSLLSGAMSELSATDHLQKVLQDMTSLLETVLANEKMLAGLGSPQDGSKEHGALKRITEALVSVHDQFTSRMKQLLEGGLRDDVIDVDMEADISKLLLGYLSLTARTLQTQCTAMKDRIATKSTERQGQLDEVKEDFLAERIKWMAETNKTKDELQAQKKSLEKQQEMLQSVGSSLQMEQQLLESLVVDLPPDMQRHFKEKVVLAQQQQQLQLHRHGGSMLSLTGSRLDLLSDGGTSSGGGGGGGNSDRPAMNRSTGNLAGAGESQFSLNFGRKSCVPGRTEMFALRELQEEKARLEKLLCRHHLELKTLKEQHEWAKSGMAVMSETKKVAEHQVDLERKQALRNQSELQVKLTASEANAHRFEEMWSLEKRRQEELSAHLLRASTELEDARAEVKVKAQMTQELQLMKHQLAEQVSVQHRLRNQLANSQRAAHEMQERLNQSAARWVQAKKDEERQRVERKWQKITRDAVELKRARAFQSQAASQKRR